MPDSSPTATPSSPSRSRVAPIVLCAVAVIMAVGVLVATRDGLVRGTDSEVYLAASDSVWEGEGLVVPFTTFTDRYSPDEAIAFGADVPLSQFGPGYPLAISAVRVSGLDAPGAARLLHALLAGLDIWLFALLVRRLTPNAPAWIVGAGVAILVVGPRGANLLFHHLFVASEALFVTLTLAALLLLDSAMKSDTTRDWTLASLVVGAALATRFAGAGLIVVAVGAALAASRWQRAVSVAAIALLPTAIFAVWSAAAGAGDRPIGWHPPDRFGHFFYETMAEWFSPRGRSWLTLPVLAAGLALVVIVVSTRRVPRVWGLCGAFIGFYLLGVLAAGVLFDHSLPVAGRLLSPLQPIAIAMLVAAAARVERLAPFLVVGAVALLALPGLRYTARLETEGVPRPPERRPITLLDSVDPSTVIFTNDPLGVYYDTRRSSRLVPRSDDVFTGGRNPDFDRDLAALTTLVCRGAAVVLMRGDSVLGVATEADLGLRRVDAAGTDVLLGCPAD